MLDKDIVALADKGLNFDEITEHYLAAHKVSQEAKDSFAEFVRDCVMLDRQTRFLDIVEARLKSCPA